MTKAQLLTEITKFIDEEHLNFKQLETTKEQAEVVLSVLLDTIQNAMERGENIYMRGFGSFVNKKRAKKMGRNVKAKIPVVIEAHFIPSFKPSQVFSDKIRESQVLNEQLKQEEKSQK